MASLQSIAPQTLKVFLGIVLIGYTGVMLGLRRFPTIAWGRKVADGMIGVNDHQFRTLVLWLLLVSGMALTVSNLT